MRKKINILLLIATLLLTSGCSKLWLHDKVHITVITKATETDFWRAVRNGCDTAASEYNVDLIFEGPNNEEDYLTQIRMIEEAIDRKTGAIVLSAIDREKLLPAIEKAAARGIYVVIIDSGIKSRIPEVIISTDNYASGKQAAEAMLKDAATPLKIGIVNFAQGTANGQEREQGFIDIIEQADAAEIIGKVSVDSNLDSAKNGTRELVENYPDLNAIISFNEYTTLGAGSALSELNRGNQIRMIGFDNNSTAIELLEDGIIDALLVQNQFAIGYLGVECAYNLITEKFIANREIYTETTVVTLENLFDESIQKIVFPLEKYE